MRVLECFSSIHSFANRLPLKILDPCFQGNLYYLVGKTGDRQTSASGKDKKGCRYFHGTHFLNWLKTKDSDNGILACRRNKVSHCALSMRP